MKELPSENRKNAVKNSFWNLITSVMIKAGGFILTIILIRILMPEGFGIYTLVFSIAMIFFSLGDLSIGSAFIRYTSHSLSKEPKKASAYHFYILKIKFIFSILSSASLLILAYPLSFLIFKNPQLFLPLIFSSVYIFMISIESFYTQLFYALEKVHYIAIKELISQTLQILGVLLILLFLSTNYHISGIFLLYTLISIAMAIFTLIYSRKLVPKLFKRDKEEIDKKSIKKFILFLTIGSVSATVFVWVDAILISLFLPIEYLGFYKSAFALIFGIAAILSFPNMVFLPILTKADSSKLKEIMDRIIRYYMILIIPSILGLLALGRYFIKLFFGDPSLPAAIPLYFLSFLIFPIILSGLLQNLFTAKEKPQVFTKLTIITSILNIILNIFLIKLFSNISPLWGIAGAAIAVEISWFFYLLGFLYYVKREFKFWVSFKSIIKPIIAGLVMFILIFASIHYINKMNIILGALEVLFGIVIYFGVLYILKGITKSDFNFFYNVIKKNN
jgi:stage V sporulation protein B